METIQQTGAVAAVLALLLLTLWWLRRRGLAGVVSLPLARKANARCMESLERLPLGPQHTLHLVRLGGAAFLISASPAGCALLHRADWQEIENTRGVL
jgi:flagellar biogenesis protein FliO